MVIYLSTCLATLWMRQHEGAPGVTPATFRAPLGPVIPIAASVISLSILAGASAQQLLAGLAALAAGAVLYAIAPRRVG